MKKISLIVPVYNESSNLEWFHKETSAFLEKELTAYSFEFIFIDDGSRDNSLDVIQGIHEKDPHVKYLSFSRNFGKEAATSAGLHHANGDAAIMIDADGQHPKELIPVLIEKWKAGYDVVVGVRESNEGEGIVKRYGSRLFYKILNAVSSNNTVPGSTDYRLIDRAVVTEFTKLTERSRITRGLIDWLGYKRTYVGFQAIARHSGTATYSYRKLLRLALHGFVSQSTRPLQATGFLGALVVLTSLFATVFLLIEKYLLGDPLNFAVTGTAILALILSLLIGLVLICQWLLAIYIESIHNETQNRPLYIIRRSSK